MGAVVDAHVLRSVGRVITACLPSRKGQCRNLPSSTLARDDNTPSAPSLILDSQQHLQDASHAQVHGLLGARTRLWLCRRWRHYLWWTWSPRVEAELSTNTSSLDNIHTPMPSLPPFGEMTYSQANEEFSKAIDEAYTVRPSTGYRTCSCCHLEAVHGKRA